MGIGFVLILYFGFLSVVAVVCGIVFSAATAYYLREIPARRRKMAITLGGFPFACIAFAMVWFIAYFAANDQLLHHDPVIGDSWYTNIGNGYAINMIDVTDQAWVHPAEGPSNGLNNPDGVQGVRRLQIAGSFIFGSQDTNWFGKMESDHPDENQFFAIDTRDRSRRTFETEKELARYVSWTGNSLNLKPVLTVYQDNRSNWFDMLALLFLLAVPFVTFLALLRKVWRTKKLYLATICM